MDAYIHEAVLRGDTFTIIFSGCNFRCPFCNAPELVEFRTEERMELKEVKALIDASSATKLLFSGGEPLLQRQALLELSSHAKLRRLTVLLETNASKPESVKSLLDQGLVDEYIVDLKGVWPKFGKVSGAGTFFQPAAEIYEDIQKSLALLRQRGARVTYKTVIVPGIHYRKEDLLALAPLLKGLEAEWLLVPLSPERTLDPKLRGVAPPTQGFLENLALLIRKEHPKLRVMAAQPKS